MITQQQEPFYTQPNGALATQFMTGGQMGYMPQAQFLTSPNYGVFRTMPTANLNQYNYQDPGFFQSMLIRSRGGLGFLPAYTFNTYNPAVNQLNYMSQMRRHVSDQMVGMAGGIMDTAGLGMSLAAPLFMSGPLGWGVGALGMAMTGMTDPFINRVRDMRTIQNMTMSKIVGGPGMNLATGMGFNAASSRSIDRFLRMSAADDALFKEGDYRQLMQLGVENGLFDYGNNAQQYKDILKKLRNSLTTMMEVVGSTDFKDITKEFKRLQTMGADISQFNTIARRENMFGRITGLSHQEMVDTYGQQGALIFSQMGLNPYLGSVQAMGNAAAVAMGQRMGMFTPSMIARFGGTSGLAQRMTQEDASAQNRMRDMILPYLMNDQMNGLDPNANPLDVLNSRNPLSRLMSRTGRINRPELYMAYQRNRDELWGKAMDKYSEPVLMGMGALAIGNQAGRSGLSAAEYGFNMMGYTPEIARSKAEFLFSNTFRDQVEREEYMARKKRQEEEDVRSNPFRKLMRWIDRGFTSFGEATYGRLARAYGEWVEDRDRFDSGFYSHHTPNVSQEALNRQRERNAGSPGGSGDPVNLPGIPRGVRDTAGALAHEFEAGSEGSRMIGYDAAGGTSYGKYQFAAKAGNFREFATYLANKQGDAEANEVGKEFLAVAGQADSGSTSGTVPTLWKNMADKYKDKFGAWEDEFASGKILGGILGKMQSDKKVYEKSDEVYQLINSSATLQKVAFSTLNNHENRKIFYEAYKDEFEKKGKSWENASKEDIAAYIANVYDRKANYAAGFPSLIRKGDFERNRRGLENRWGKTSAGNPYKGDYRTGGEYTRAMQYLDLEYGQKTRAESQRRSFEDVVNRYTPPTGNWTKEDAWQSAFMPSGMVEDAIDATKARELHRTVGIYASGELDSQLMALKASTKGFEGVTDASIVGTAPGLYKDAGDLADSGKATTLAIQFAEKLLGRKLSDDDPIVKDIKENKNDLRSRLNALGMRGAERTNKEFVSGVLVEDYRNIVNSTQKMGESSKAANKAYEDWIESIMPSMSGNANADKMRKILQANPNAAIVPALSEAFQEYNNKSRTDTGKYGDLARALARRAGISEDEINASLASGHATEGLLKKLGLTAEQYEMFRYGNFAKVNNDEAYRKAQAYLVAHKDEAGIMPDNVLNLEELAGANKLQAALSFEGNYNLSHLKDKKKRDEIRKLMRERYGEEGVYGRFWKDVLNDIDSTGGKNLVDVTGKYFNKADDVWSLLAMKNPGAASQLREMTGGKAKKEEGAASEEAKKAESGGPVSDGTMNKLVNVLEKLNEVLRNMDGRNTPSSGTYPFRFRN